MSFSILKTNVGLTTNTKIMIDSKYKMYLESIDSVVELSSQTYKKFEFNKGSLYDETLSLFIGNVPSEIAYAIRYEDDNDNMYTNFYNQNDDLYQCGARNIYNNKNYKEEYEYFAPLYVDDILPSNFIIFRVDGPGNINLTKDNFITEIVKKIKVVKSFDLGRSSILGEWLYKNYIENEYYISNSLVVDVRENYFSSVGGIDIVEGGYVRKSLNTNELFSVECTFNDMNSHFHSLYSKNSIAFPNIINLNFLYDDTPSTPDYVREWSLNRYYGFYFDSLECVQKYTFYKPIELVSSVLVLANNIISHIGHDSPFVDKNSTNVYYVEINGEYSKIVSFEDVVGYGLVNIPGDTIIQKKDVIKEIKWKIISVHDYNGYTFSDMNKHGIDISANGTISGAILPPNEMILSTDLWLVYFGDEYIVVEIDVDNDGVIFMNSDYSFSMHGNDVIVNSGGGIIKTIKSVNDNGEPLSFGLFRCNFTDIKDFDINIINSGFANFEYDIDNTIVKNDESKLYYSDYSSSAKPIEIDEFLVNGKIENVPVSSEFISNGELFELINDDLTPLWRKNANWCKWGFNNSNNTFDYPYLLNNSLIGEDFNRGVNVFLETPNRVERNLDYFYTIIDESISRQFSFHSLHTIGEFEFDKYLGSFGNNIGYDSDYFTYYFGKDILLSNGLSSMDKWSKFNESNGVLPNNSVFRGMKFNLYDVKSIKLTNNEISEINIESSTAFSGYKLSILASVNHQEITNGENGIGLVSTNTHEDWCRISQYDLGAVYNEGDVVMYYDILWHCENVVADIDPNLNPVNSYHTNGITRNWTVGSGITHVSMNKFKGMWGPDVVYDVSNHGDVVLYAGEYMRVVGGVVDIWNPLIGYNSNEIIYKSGTYYKALSTIIAPIANSVVEEPGCSKLWQKITLSGAVSGDYLIGSYQEYDISTNSWIENIENIHPKWEIISIWSPNNNYAIGDYIYWDGTLYLSQSTVDVEPGYSESVWLPLHTLEVKSDSSYLYGELVTINGEFYISIGDGTSGIDSGITIYINKKWKNILINITSNDGLVANISNAKRDLMYSYENSKMTAFNFIDYINGLNVKKGFSKSLTYVIINVDNTIEYYNGENIKNTPYYLNIEKPDVLYTIVDSLEYENVDINMNKFKINFILDKSIITSIETKNWYNGGIGLATKINKNLNNIQLVNGYHGLTNVVYNKLFRYSGDYSPIFKKIELFASDVDNVGNYKFATQLLNFGMASDVIVSKVNSKKNILKLNNVLDTKSIYPMIDEFGYTVMDKFIFKSTWDDNFYIEVLNNDRSVDKNVKNNKIIN